jgi:hypothetical protein
MFCCAPNRASVELPVNTRTLAVDAPSSADARASARDRGTRTRRREDAWVRGLISPMGRAAVAEGGHAWLRPALRVRD